jgi:hypothetical protein
MLVLRLATAFKELSIDVVINKYRSSGSKRYMTLSTDAKTLFRYEFTYPHKGHASQKVI